MFERFIAMRFLRSRKNAGFASVVIWFSFLGIAIGVATLIIVTSVMNGFKEELLETIVGMKGHLVVDGSEAGFVKNFEDVATKIKNSNQNILAVVPLIEREAILMVADQAKGVLTHGLSQKSLRDKKLIADNIKYGSIDDFGKDFIFIGKRLAESFHIKVGDSVSLFIPGGISTPFGMLPKEEMFKIGGIFEVGMYDYDKNIILLPLESAQSFFNIHQSVTQIEIFVKNMTQTKNVIFSIKDVLTENMRILDWRHADANIFHAVVVQKNVMSLILSIIILIAVFNIMSSLIMLTNSKTKDIAILRTIGATKNSILRIFFYIGSCIGLLGTATGVGVGLLVSLNVDTIKKKLESFSNSELFSEEIYFLSQLPSKTEFSEVCIIAVCAILLCFIATLYPALKAARLDPVEAFRS